MGTGAEGFGGGQVPNNLPCACVTATLEPDIGFSRKSERHYKSKHFALKFRHIKTNQQTETPGLTVSSGSHDTTFRACHGMSQNTNLGTERRHRRFLNLHQ